MTDEEIALAHELVNADNTAHLYCVPRSRVLAALAAARLEGEQNERQRYMDLWSGKCGQNVDGKPST